VAFENTEFTSVTAFLGGGLNATGIVQFNANQLNLIFQRKLIAYNAFAYYTNPPLTLGFVPMEYMDIRFNIIQPLNTTEQFTLQFSTPIGGTFFTFTNIVVLQGNTRTVSILPLPLKVIDMVINLHDPASAGFDVNAHLTLYWETKKRAKFVGED